MNRVIRIALACLFAGFCMTVIVDAQQKKTAPKKSETKSEAKIEAKSGKAIPESRLGLAHGTVYETLSPDPVNPDASDPGTKALLPRWNAVAPPMVPHGIDDFLPIELDSNMCVSCHLIEEKSEGDPTPLPASHLAPRADDGGDAVVAGNRWICLSCHVPLTDAKPLPATTRPAKATAP